MELTDILKKSFLLLLEKPKMFIPNLFTSLLYAVFELILIYLTINLIHGILNLDSLNTLNTSQYILSKTLITDIKHIIILLLFYPLVGAIDLITYGMYPSMVMDYHSNREISLIKSLRDSIASWKILLSLGIIFAFFIIAMFMVLLILFIFSLILNEGIILFLSVPVVLILIIILMMAVFFVVPVGVIKRRSIIRTFTDSFKLTSVYRGDVFKLTLLLTVLIIIAIFLGFMVNIRKIGVEITAGFVLLFILLRIIQSVIYTYIFTVNPYFYLLIKNEL